MVAYHTEQTRFLHLNDSVVINEELYKPDGNLLLKECASGCLPPHIR